MGIGLDIKNANLFLIGLIILMVGIFIVVFDFSQIQYFENSEINPNFLVDEEQKNVYQRLKIEFSIGIVFLAIGTVLGIFSINNKTEKKI